MKEVQIRNLLIGDGTVKICLPISSAWAGELLVEASDAANSPCEIVEWRADYLADLFFDEFRRSLLAEIRERTSGKALLFTLRTREEGGMFPHGEKEYFSLCREAAASGLIDILDFELSKEKKALSEGISFVKACGVKVLLSAHLFGEAPNREKLLDMLSSMEALDADIAKLAVTVKNEEEADFIMETAAEASENCIGIPLVMIAMGEAGKKTRRLSPYFGTSLTYARGKNTTAPGQLSWQELLSGVGCGGSGNGI